MNSGSFDGGLLNLANWVGNIMMPTVGVLFLIIGIYKYSKGDGAERYVAGAMASFCVSALLRVAEEFTKQASGEDQYYMAILTLVNYLGNVILPVYAGLEVVRAFLCFAVASQLHVKERWVRHITTAGACVSVSALTRLLEAFIIKGTQL